MLNEEIYQGITTDFIEKNHSSRTFTCDYALDNIIS
jgi:hypothetical protein